jgi:hypothetical protein
MNSKWEEVIELAEKYGFIHYCYGGVAILMTPKEKKKLKEENNNE